MPRRSLLQRISWASSSSTPGSTTQSDQRISALDNAKTVFQLVENIGKGALNIPGLQTAGAIGAQIIDIIKVHRIYFRPCMLNSVLINHDI